MTDEEKRLYIGFALARKPRKERAKGERLDKWRNREEIDNETKPLHYLRRPADVTHRKAV